MRVLVTVPNLHWLHKLVVHRLLLLQQDRRYRVMIQLPSNKPFENNLHHIINDFMAGDWDFWLSMDDDNPPEKNPLDLIELDKDIIGLPTPVWHYTGKKGERPIYWNAYDYRPGNDAYAEHEPKDGLQRVDAIGTGCFLIARRVFENQALRQGAFTRKLNDDGTVRKGNDLSFSERAREQGFEIWAHYGYHCRHVSEVELIEVERAIIGMM